MRLVEVRKENGYEEVSQLCGKVVKLLLETAEISYMGTQKPGIIKWSWVLSDQESYGGGKGQCRGNS